MPDDIFGVPTHPLLVHLVVVLLPLSALGGVLSAVLPAFARRYGSLVALGAVACVPATFLAQEAGGSLEQQVNATLSGPTASAEAAAMERHTELGDQLLPWVIVLAVGAVALAVVTRQLQRAVAPVTVGGGADDTRPTSPRNLVIARWVSVVVVVVGAAVSAYLVIRIGHLGAEAAWTRVTDT